MPSKFIAQEKSLQAIKSIQPLIKKIAVHDSSLADQLRRAASSIVLNIAEGAYSHGKLRYVRFHSAIGSANESRAALHLAIAWGYLDQDDSKHTAVLLDEIVKMLWTLIKHKR